MQILTFAIIHVLFASCVGYRIVTSSDATIAQLQANKSEKPRTFSNYSDPLEWLTDQFKGMVTTVRTVMDDDDAPMGEIRAAAAKIVSKNGGNVTDYARAIKHCSWLQSVSEASAKPIRQRIPDNFDLGLTLKARSKEGYIGRYELAVVSVQEGSVAQDLGIVPGMHPRLVRGQATTFFSSNHMEHGDMTFEQFDAALKGTGPPEVIWDSPNYEQRRKAAIHECFLGITSVCSPDNERPLEITAVEINYRADHCGGCHFFCAERPQSKYEMSGVEEWSSLFKPGEAVDVRVPLQVKTIDLPDGAPQGIELSGNVIQVDSATSREQCLFTGMTLLELNGERLEAEQPLDRLDGAWRYKSFGSDKEYFVQRRRNDESDELEYYFLEKFTNKEKTGLLVETDMENGRWWLANLNDGEQIRLRRDGVHMISQHRSSSSSTFKSPVRSHLLSPGERLEVDPGNTLSLKVRPMGSEDVKAVVKTVRTHDSMYCAEGQAEVQFFVDRPDEAWLRAFSRVESVPLSFPTFDMRSSFQCDAFIADSFAEVVDKARDVAKEDLKWGTLQISVSITAGVTAVVFPPALGLHGAAFVATGVGIKSVGTALKAGAHGAERVSRGGKFNTSAFAIELGVGVGLNAVSIAGGHLIGHAVGHALTHEVGQITGQTAEGIIDIGGEHAAHNILHKESTEANSTFASEPLSDHCMDILFAPEGVFY